MNTRARLFVLSAALLLGGLSLSWAGGPTSSFKGKIQQKLNERNVQYEPYYQKQVQQSDGEYWGSDSNSAHFFSATGDHAGQVASGERLRMENDQVRNGMAAVPCDRKKVDAPSKPLPAAQPAQPMSNYVIYNMTYNAELEENVVTVKGEIVFEVFDKTGVTQLPLVNNKVGLIDVRVNKGASFVASQGDKYYLIMHKPGRYNVDFEFLIKAAREREHGPGSFSVDVVPAPISQFEFSIAEKDTQVFIEPAIKVETTMEGDKTTAWAVLPNTSRINVRWTKALPKEQIVSAKLDPKLYAETSTYSTIGGGVISSVTNINYSILQSEVSSLRVALPTDVSVLDVQGNELRDWKVSTKDDTQYLDVFLNFGVKGNFPLTVRYERNITEGSGVLQMPWVKALGVERENGYYGIAASTNVELAVKSSDKVTAIDTKQLPAFIWGNSANPLLLAFKYLNPPFDITIEVTRHEELPVLVAAIDMADHVTLRTKEGKVLTKATYQVRNNVKQFLRLKLPAKSKVWSSFVAGKPVKPAVDKDGRVLLPLEKSRMQGNDLTQFPVEVVYLTEDEKLGEFGSIKTALPDVDVPISQFYWSMFLPMDLNYYNIKGDLRVEQPNTGYVQRGMQGRMQMAQDDIGDQFVPQSQVMLKSQVAARVLQAPAEQESMRGILPITVNVPQQGKLYRFSKLLVVEGESPSVTMTYTALWEKVEKPLKAVAWIAVLALLVIWFKRRLPKK